MKVCEAWLTCPCECHETITMMFLLGETPRRTMDNPEYVPPEHSFWMPTPEEMLALKPVDPAERPALVEKSDHALVPDMVVHKFRDTASGRTAKGQLEEWVERACSMWLKGDRKEECTTAYTSEWIDSEYGTAPSRGAIQAVWNRWVDYGFAVLMTKPVQFVGYTKAGRERGLAVLRDEYKRKNKQAAKAVALGRR